MKEHEYLTNEPQTINLGGKYLYSFLQVGKKIIVKRKLNDKYIPNFFNISESKCRINLLSAVVGQNGAGKSSMLDVIRGLFVEHVHSMPHNISTIIIEAQGETKVLYSTSKVFLVIEGEQEKTDTSIINDVILQDTLSPEGYKELEKINITDYQSIYYSPHFDLKYNHNFDEVDKYDISLDFFIKQDLEDTDKKGTNENGWRFALHEELVFKNSMRQIEFLSSSLFQNNMVFREVFNLPEYETGILHFRDVEIPNFHNTPRPLRPIIELILEKAENESDQWYVFRDQNSELDRNLRDSLVNKYLLERFVIKAFMSVVIQQMEKENTWLEEGNLENSYDTERFKSSSAKEVLYYFIKESYIKRGDFRKSIFNYEEIFPFFEKLDSLFIKETNPNNIRKQSIRLNLGEVKEILELHKRIIINLIHYYPSQEGLISKEDYVDGFVAFRPTDRSMSSGENALLNFFSKLNNFIQNNLIKESKILSEKENYILLLDEADLGFHPVWKKKYVDAILKTIPFFFEPLEVKPELQIVITTHDPLTLSDLPINNVVFLQKDNQHCSVITENDTRKIQRTFGANITDLLAHSFFVDEGLIGDFSKMKIKEVIEWINKSQSFSNEKKSSEKFKSELEHYKKVVNLIDEKVVKMKLAEMITDLVPDKEYYNQVVENEIRFLRTKMKT